MNYIKRNKYIKKIEGFIDKPIIKILTGMRRVGKSTLLKIISDEILADVLPENKIHLNFESLELINIRDANSLLDYLMPIIKNTSGKIYFFFDEVQLVDGWERVINGINVDVDCDIYLTGSNSTLISSDLATLLAGRYVEFEIQPFTFSEFLEIFSYSGLSRDELFNHFIEFGGMPFLSFFGLDKESSFKYLGDVYNTVLIKDVLQYYDIRDIDVFNRILSYVTENIGHTFSANGIRNYFKSENRNISIDTILNYLEYCNRAFILKKVPRYDTVGKKLLKVDEKYFLTDHGFRQAKGFSNSRDIERVLENIVFIELLSRGYKVKIGKLKDREIDFIAENSDGIIYFQVTYLMESESTREREFGIYKQLNDNYPKYVLSMDKVDFSQDGIIHRNIIDFLMDV